MAIRMIFRTNQQRSKKNTDQLNQHQKNWFRRWRTFKKLHGTSNKMTEWKCSLILLPWTQIIYNLGITFWGWIGEGGGGGGQLIGSYMVIIMSLSGSQLLPSTVIIIVSVSRGPNFDLFGPRFHFISFHFSFSFYLFLQTIVDDNTELDTR